MMKKQCTDRFFGAGWLAYRGILGALRSRAAVLWIAATLPLLSGAADADAAKGVSKSIGPVQPLTAVSPPAVRGNASRTDLVPADKSSYLIRSGDVVEVRVYQEDDLNSKTRVDEEGTVVLPLIGRVPVRGLNTELARKAISDRYEADYLNHPQVTVLVSDFAPRRFVMMGQVARPGVYEIPSSERLNLLQAIAMAGGYTKIADPTKVRIRRSTEKGEEVMRYNAKALAIGGGGEVPMISSEDNITVGESAF